MLAARPTSMRASFIGLPAQRHELRQLVLARLDDVRGLHQDDAAGGGQRSLPIGQGFGRGLYGPLRLLLVGSGGGTEYLGRVRGVHYLRGLARVCGDPLTAYEVQGFYLRFDQGLPPGNTPAFSLYPIPAHSMSRPTPPRSPGGDLRP